MAREAYANWDSLEEVDGNANVTGLLTQGPEIVNDQYPPNHSQAIIRSGATYEQNLYLPGNNISHMECMNDNWQLHSPYFGGLPQVQQSISESSSDGDLTPHGLP